MRVFSSLSRTRSKKKTSVVFPLLILLAGITLTIVMVQKQQNGRQFAAEPTAPATGATFSLTVFLHGIGKGGDNTNSAPTGNTNPLHSTRNAILFIINANNQLVAQAQGNIQYNSTSGNFQGSIPVSSLASGNYLVQVKVDGFLRKQLPGIITVTQGLEVTLPAVYLVSGDIISDNLLSILDYNALVSCFGSKQTSSSCQAPTLSDINDDGVVDGVDYNLLLRELSVQRGDTDAGTPSPTLTTAVTLTNTPTPTPSIPTWQSHIQAWIYPGNPACNASNEYADGRVIDTLKPQYFTLQSNGTLYELTVAADGCNAYSAANAASIKQYSRHQFITVSGNTETMRTLFADASKKTQAISAMISLLNTTHFTGMDIDFEGFAQWLSIDYSNYKSFLTELGNSLHQNGYKLMVDGPPLAADSSTYSWHYGDFNSLPVDYVTVMEYDWEYDFGAGTPVAPLSREQSVTQFVLSQITDPNKVVIGLPAYGYHGTTDGDSISIDTYTQSSTYPGFSTAQRDRASAEMMWTNNGVSYDYADSMTLNTKRTNLENLGAKNISVWHLGGNQWFSGKAEPQ